MAGHEARLRRMVAAIHGEESKPVGDGKGGSVNYRLMDRLTGYITGTRGARSASLEILSEMQRVGHLSLDGPNGVATEAGSPAAHWAFNQMAVLGGLKWALRRGDSEIVIATTTFVADEIGLDLEHRYGGRVCLPAPRVKDEKHEAPLDGYRDVAVALVLGERVKKNSRYWEEPLATAVATLRELLGKHKGLRDTLREAQMPKLYLPIIKTQLEDGGFRAEIEDTPEARKAMGRDGCHVVEIGPQGARWKVDWEDAWRTS